MRKVYKYEVPYRELFSLELPRGAQLLRFDNQKGVPTLWALVDPDATSVFRNFLLAGTGHPITEENIQFIGTAQFSAGSLVFHLLEVLP